ncbi:hypothetical protein [Sphingomonas sp. BK580]|uniref:hypothetical protein n=1 Tax=Sphingomonas sp. BK580 TaxID=2586972 RepID=UPI0016104803|nr:hypothetical protein [Sphingomonas sp. BK580]MBB3695788.1 hypothetical protein [Sphingomonas sp. BK580]
MALLPLMRGILAIERQPGELVPHNQLDRLAGFGLITSAVLYLCFNAFGGMVRGILGPIGLAPIAYLPFVVGLVSLLANTLARVGDPQTSTSQFVVLAFLFLEVLISISLGRSIGVVLFSLYICTAIFVAMAVTQRGMQDRMIRAMVPIFYVSVVGVVLSSIIEFPWAHSTYEVMGVQREATREWSAGGRARLAGFSQASYMASAVIIISYCAAEHECKTLFKKALCWAAGCYAIYLTTSKSVLLAMLALPVTYAAIGRIQANDGAKRKSLATILLAFWVMLIFAGPLLSITYGKQIYPQGVGEGPSYSSLADRVLNTWPQAIGLVDWSNPASWLVGRGLGGIGGPMAMVDPNTANSADNLAVYLIVMFGAVSIAIGYLIFRGGQRAIDAGGRGRREFAMIIAMLGVGTAANVIEATFTAMVVGLAVGRQPSRSAAYVKKRRGHRARDKASGTAA